MLTSGRRVTEYRQSIYSRPGGKKSEETTQRCYRKKHSSLGGNRTSATYCDYVARNDLKGGMIQLLGDPKEEKGENQKKGRRSQSMFLGRKGETRPERWGGRKKKETDV